MMFAGTKGLDTLPTCYPKGPWLIDPSQNLDDKVGWRAAEERMVSELQNYCTDRKTPKSVTDNWLQGGFALKVITRSMPAGR